MKPYSEFRPTRFDTQGLGCDDQQDWLVAPCGTNRDADILTRANWEAQSEILDAADPTGEDHETHRFGHWGPGWFEIALVRPGSKAAQEAEECEAALSDYPVLNDNKYSDMQFEATCEYWRTMSIRERVEVCSRVGCSIFAARRDEVPEQAFDYLEERL